MRSFSITFHSFVATIALLIATILGTSTTQATILNPTGNVTIVSPPSDVSIGALESDTTILAFPEQQNVTLPDDITVDITLPGTSPFNGVQNLSAGVIPAGTEVDSYFVHFDKVGDSNSTVTAMGSIAFDSNVLGLLVLDNELNLTNSFPGLPGTNYGIEAGRGLEIVGGGANTGNNDQITLSADRRTVSFSLRNGQTPDDFRVITAVPEPSTFVLLAIGFVLPLWRLLRNRS
jgi:hypothetical protein